MISFYYMYLFLDVFLFLGNEVLLFNQSQLFKNPPYSKLNNNIWCQIFYGFLFLKSIFLCFFILKDAPLADIFLFSSSIYVSLSMD